MNKDPIIIFVCEHGAAKSVIAAAYFNHLARARNLDLRAIARGTNPESEFSAKTLEGLQRDDLMLPEGAPQRLTSADIESARQIVTFCELPIEYQHIRGGRFAPIIEQWDNIPPVSENYAEARDAIVEHLKDLIKT